MKATLKNGLYIVDERRKASAMTTYLPSQNLMTYTKEWDMFITAI
ncbi:hypothetical protein M0804_015143 [Polistes exclamans]|nr:hypothetical protein M0804_015143 [Polistes exclamans]